MGLTWADVRAPALTQFGGRARPPADLAGASAGNWTALSADPRAGAKTLDTVAAAQEAYYQKNFNPLQRQMQEISAGGNFRDVLAQTQEAGMQGREGVDSAEGGFQRQLRNLGGVGESSSAVRQFGLRRALAQVDAMNRSSQTSRTLQESAQSYGLGQTIENAQTTDSILQSIANAETDRINQRTGANAAESAGKKQMAGAGVSTAITVIAML